MPRALFVTDHVPGRDAGFQKSGHGHYLQTFVDHFIARGFDVTLLVLRPKVDFIRLATEAIGYRIEGPAFRTDAASVTLVAARDRARTLAWRLFARLPRRLQNALSALRLRLRERRGFSHDLGRSVSDAERAYVRDAAARLRPAVVVYDGIFNVCGKLGTAQHWVITHEVKHQRARSFSERGVAVVPRDFDADAERRIIADVGNVIAIQGDDAREFHRLAPGARVVVVPVAMDVAADAGARRPTPGRCAFVGSGSYHNYDGIRWFLDACWPRVRAAVPEATLEIVGTVCYRLGEVPPGVILRGVVDDLGCVYRETSVAIVPLNIGSGLKVKIVEALAHGAPVVTTSVGAQGLAAVRPAPFVVADDAAAFAAACVDLLRSETRQRALASAARACAATFRAENAFADFAAASRCEPVA